MRLSIKESIIGSRGYIVVDDMHIEVRILDVKDSWGRIRYLVTPVSGEGQTWKENVLNKDLIDYIN